MAKDGGLDRNIPAKNRPRDANSCRIVRGVNKYTENNVRNRHAQRDNHNREAERLRCKINRTQAPYDVPDHHGHGEHHYGLGGNSRHSHKSAFFSRVTQRLPQCTGRLADPNSSVRKCDTVHDWLKVLLEFNEKVHHASMHSIGIL